MRLGGHGILRLPTGSGLGTSIIQVIGGQIVGGSDVIQYASSLTLTQTYDPDVDTDYPVGLGRGWLWIDGQQEERVLVRHSNAAYTAPLFGGQKFDVMGEGSETVASGPDAGEILNVYLVF